MSVRLDEAIDAITSRMKTQVGDAESVTVIYDNDDTKAPNNALHVRFRLIRAPSEVVETGGDSHTIRTRGLFRAKIKTPIRTGTSASHALMRVILEAFRAQTVAGVTYYAPSPGDNFVDGAWWVQNVEIPWESHEIT